MNLAITIFDIAMMTLVSWVFLKKPLEEKDIEGGSIFIGTYCCRYRCWTSCQLYDELIGGFYGSLESII